MTDSNISMWLIIHPITALAFIAIAVFSLTVFLSPGMLRLVSSLIYRVNKWVQDRIEERILYIEAGQAAVKKYRGRILHEVWTLSTDEEEEEKEK